MNSAFCILPPQYVLLKRILDIQYVDKGMLIPSMFNTFIRPSGPADFVFWCFWFVCKGLQVRNPQGGCFCGRRVSSVGTAAAVRVCAAAAAATRVGATAANNCAVCSRQSLHHCRRNHGHRGHQRRWHCYRDRTATDTWVGAAAYAIAIAIASVVATSIGEMSILTIFAKCTFTKVTMYISAYFWSNCCHKRIC